MGDGVGVVGVGQIAVNARDLQRAVEFYRDRLGLRFLFEIPGAAFFQCGAVRLMIGVAETPEEDHPASVLYYRVDDIHASYGALREAGVDTVGEPHRIARLPDHELWMTFFRDSEGNLAALMSEVRG